MKEQEHPPSSIEQASFERLGRGIQRSAKKGLFNRLFNGFFVPPNQQDWVADAHWQQMQQQPLAARGLLYAIAVAVILLLVWAAYAQLDEVTRGEGRVIPSQKLQIVQSYDGGMVEQILVKEGQVVEQGDLLVKVDPTRFVSSLRESRAQYLGLSAEVARLQALTAHTELVFSDELKQQAPNAIKYEQAQYRSNKQELTQQIRIHQRQLEQRRQDYNETAAAIEQYRASLALSQRELRVTRPLLQSGAVSEVDIIRLERQAVDLQGEIKRAQAALKRTQAAIEEAQSKIDEVELTMVNRWRDQLSDSMLRLDALRETQTGLADKVTQTDIRSPVRGTVQRLLVNTVGAVLQPGSDLVEIIPLDDQLLVEAKVAPQDIAFLRPGQPAMIKLTAYDFTIYGGLEAQVTHISADTVTDERDNTYYLVQLKTSRGSLSEQLTIIPGMTTQVDIITGQKTVLDYLLKPILKATSQAMTER
ncbi:HlyD family type I secretion periplasmic adaptor subunit [Pseudoalteromonas ruthenica]|uniref:HlyD family type I secretion periplasmic adaptor subunit n=1 Tax=Pseudoalteromonas ruthenica TaxID=151081 RepID=UPI00241E803B|nr:HlyD family type I secretion periplasmic adaptor subunit [Pseudoalteromonas ruthenica]|tara:strand:- start:49363 stop:50787 length:1425 start_codon:yes stop_codon:yes gene_type:complete